MEESGKLQSMGSLRVGHDFTFTFPFHFHALEKEMATHSSVLAWRIPGMAGPWWAAIYGVAESRTRLKRLSSSSSSIFPFLLYLSLLFFSQLFVRPPQTTTLPFCLPFFLGMVSITASFTKSRMSQRLPSVSVHMGLFNMAACSSKPANPQASRSHDKLQSNHRSDMPSLLLYSIG